MGRAICNLQGMRFGRLTALYRTQGKYWMCQCDCGKKKEYSTSQLNQGGAKTCGCHIGANKPKGIRIENNDVYVLTSKGEFVTDIEALPIIEEHGWNITKNGYPMTNDTHECFHKLYVPGSGVVDHINQNKLDNRKNNLRLTNYSINAINRKSGTNTGYYGISNSHNGFVVYVLGHYIGYFKSIERALEERNKHPLFVEYCSINPNAKVDV